MKKTLILSIILGIGLSLFSCAEKTTEEKLEEKTEKAEKEIKKFGDKLKKEVED